MTDMTHELDTVSLESLDFAGGNISRLLGVVSVEERNSKIIVKGIAVRRLMFDIDKFSGTTRVTKNMFSKVSMSYVELDSFFAIEFEYMIRNLQENPRTYLGKRTYTKLLEELRNNTWLSRLNSSTKTLFNWSKIKELTWDLLPYQKEFIEFFDKTVPKYELRGMLMAADPGTGKTFTSIAIAELYESENVIIIGPKATVFDPWDKTLREVYYKSQTVWIYASGTPMPSPNDCRFFVFHYEALETALDLAKTISNRKCTIILDESHNFNDMKSLRTNRFIELCSMMNNSIVVDLSGTPLKALGSEAIPLIRAVDPKFTPECAERFRKIWGANADRATDILLNRLGFTMFRVIKDEEMLAAPVETDIFVKTPDAKKFTLESIKDDMRDFIEERVQHYRITYPQHKATFDRCLKIFEAKGLHKVPNPMDYQTYRTYVEEFIANGYDRFSSPPKAVFCNHFEKNYIEPCLDSPDRHAFRDSKSVVKYVDLKIRGECLGTVLGKARMACNISVLNHLDLSGIIDNVEKKTLIFTSYVDVVKATETRLKELGYKPICVFAETNNNLPAIVKKFGTDVNINPLVATYQSLSTGVPLTMANGIILLNAPFRIHEKKQTIARAHRLGQDKTVYVYNVFLDTGDVPNISTRSNDILKWSEEQVNALMDIDNGVDVGMEGLSDVQPKFYETDFHELPEDVNHGIESIEEKSITFKNLDYYSWDFDLALEALKQHAKGDPDFDNIRPVMQEEMGHVKITPQLIKDIRHYVSAYVNKDEEHIAFFGSNLTGVNRIIYTTEDRNNWCLDILDIDEHSIKRKIKALPNIGEHWVRGTDGVNLSLIYLMHLIMTSKLPDNLKRQGFVDCFIILQIKFLSSILYAYFKYPVPEELAIEVYNALSKKYYIKKYGTWYAILEHRALDEFGPQSIHWDVVMNFNTDQGIQNMITDVQTRLKSMILNIYEVTVRLNKTGKGIATSSVLGEKDGKIEFKDIEKNFDTYMNYLLAIVPEPNAFIKKEVVEVVSGSIVTMPEKLLYDLLNVISKKSAQGDEKLNEHLREILIFMFDYFKANKRDIKDMSNLGLLITNLKSLFTASKSTSPAVLKLRAYFDKLVKDNIKSKNPATIAGVRTGIVLYVIVRTLTKNYFN